MADEKQLSTFGIDDLAEAMNNGDLTLAYQPKIALKSRAMVGVEAFARWRHPVLGPISPSDFIPLAEMSNLIDPFTEWAIGTAAADWATWHRQGVTMDIAVNVSAKNFRRLEFPDIAAGICQAQGMPTRHLVIELTESAEQNVVQLQDTLARLRIKGMGVSLDDFGTGYSSLLQLQRLPFTEIKIDRSFVTNADASREARIILKSTIGLAHALELKAVAEGVETHAVATLLAEFGCEIGQGYHFAQPMPARDLFAWSLSQPSVLAPSLRFAV